MKRLFLASISVVLWIYFIISSIILTPISLVLWLLTVLFDKNLRILHLFSCFWGAQYLWVVPFWSLRILDRHKYDNRNRYVVVSNHQSLADIVVIYSLFKHFRWTSKAEVFKMPFVGWVLSINRSLKINRGASDAYQRFEEQAVKALNAGNSIMIFPEGTRSRDGRLGRFKEGAFRIAHVTATDILPMVLEGTSKAIPKSGWILAGKQKMLLKVLDPIPYGEFAGMNYSETTDVVRNRFKKALSEIRSGDE